MENQALREHRFSATNPPPSHTQKHPNGYLTCKLKKLLLKKKFRYEDPETQKILKASGGDAIVLKYVWEALQGNVQAIEGIFDRIDGKLSSNNNEKGLNGNVVIQIIRPEANSADTNERIHIKRALMAEED